MLSDVRSVDTPTSAPGDIRLPEIPFLRFAADDTYQGSDGCNGVAGTYTLDSGVLTLHGAVTTFKYCPGENTNVFLRVTARPMSVTVAVGRLTLMTANQERLGFQGKP